MNALYRMTWINKYLDLAFVVLAAYLGTLVGGALSHKNMAGANVPASGLGVGSPVTDDTALYQNLSEIRIKREVVPSFDSDLRSLKALESRYRGRPMRRILAQPYRAPVVSPGLQQDRIGAAQARAVPSREGRGKPRIGRVESAPQVAAPRAAAPAQESLEQPSPDAKAAEAEEMRRLFKGY